MTVSAERTILSFDTRGALPSGAGEKVIMIKSPVVEDVHAEFPISASGHESWIVFTDLIAVRSFLNIVPTDFDPDDFRICAPGGASADMLRNANIHCDLIPVPNDPGSTAAAIYGYADSLSGVVVWIIGSINGSEYFTNLLHEYGTVTEIFEVYRLSFESSGETGRMRALLLGGGIDEMRFSGECEPELFKQSGLGPEIVSGIDITCHDHKTLNAAIETGFVRVRLIK